MRSTDSTCTGQTTSSSCIFAQASRQGSLCRNFQGIFDAHIQAYLARKVSEFSAAVCCSKLGNLHRSEEPIRKGSAEFVVGDLDVP